LFPLGSWIFLSPITRPSVDKRSEMALSNSASKSLHQTRQIDVKAPLPALNICGTQIYIFKGTSSKDLNLCRLLDGAVRKLCAMCRRTFSPFLGWVVRKPQPREPQPHESWHGARHFTTASLRLHYAFTNARNRWCPLAGTTSTKQLKADILERVKFAYRSNRFTVQVAPVAQLTTLVVAILQNCPNSSLRILLEPHSYVRPSLYRKDRWIHPGFFFFFFLEQHS
jgi:hypothetical protein